MMMQARRLVCGAGLAVTALTALASPAAATVITTNSPIASCTTYTGAAAVNCVDTVSYSNTIATSSTPFLSGNVGGVNPATANFQTSFNAWDAANGNAVTLVNGGVLPLTFSVNIGAGVSSTAAGINPIIVNINNYTPTGSEPSMSQLAWTQALFNDYSPNAGLVNYPIATLDTYSLSASPNSSLSNFRNACTPIPGPPNADNNTTPSTIPPTPSNSAYCDPIYPFQYGTSDNGTVLGGTTLQTGFFYDAPSGPWANGAFRGIALLSTFTYDTNADGTITNEVLTTYQGIDYGFTLSATVVPEPTTLAVLTPAVAGVLLWRRRRATAV